MSEEIDELPTTPHEADLALLDLIEALADHVEEIDARIEQLEGEKSDPVVEVEVEGEAEA